MESNIKLALKAVLIMAETERDEICYYASVPSELNVIIAAMKKYINE